MSASAAIKGPCQAAAAGGAPFGKSGPHRPVAECRKEFVKVLGVEFRDVRAAVSRGVDQYFGKTGGKEIEMQVSVVDGDDAKKIVEALRKAGVIGANGKDGK